MVFSSTPIGRARCKRASPAGIARKICGSEFDCIEIDYFRPERVRDVR